MKTGSSNAQCSSAVILGSLVSPAFNHEMLLEFCPKCGDVWGLVLFLMSRKAAVTLENKRLLIVMRVTFLPLEHFLYSA